jgi:hypothetical protein
LAQAQRIAGQAVPVVEAGVEALHVGQVYVWQQVFGSTPAGIGVAPSGQTGANVGHATGLFGSHVGFAGTHCPSHVWPLQLPFASHTHDGSPAGHAHVDGGTGGTLVPVAGSVDVPVPPPVVAPVLQPQPAHVTEHACPVGQSVSALQPFWIFGTQTPKQSVGHDVTSQPHEPSAFSRQRPVEPALLPSAQTYVGSPSTGPHFAGSQVAAVAGAVTGGSRQVDRSQRASAPQSASALHTPCAGWHVHGPPQTSFLSQTTSSPALQLGVVQPQRRLVPSAGVVAAGSTVTGHGHWYTGQQSLVSPTITGCTFGPQYGSASVHAVVAWRVGSHVVPSGSQR